MQIPFKDVEGVEKGINDIAEIAFDAGYMRALKDVLDNTNGKVALEISRIVIAGLNKEKAKSFVKDHPFKFILK